MSRDGIPIEDDRRTVIKGLAALGAVSAAGLAGARTVDHGRGAGASATSTVWFDGLENQPVGAATLTKSGGDLVVDNVDGGDDGVAVTSGESDGIGTRHVVDPSGEPAGSYRELEATAVVDGSTQSAGTFRMRRLESTAGYALQPDFTALGSDTYTLRVYHDGSEVLTESGLSGEVTAAKDGSCGGCCCCDCDCCCDCCCDDDWWWESAWDWDATVTTPSGTSVTGDRAVFVPDSFAPASISVTDVSVVADGISQFRITGEHVTAFTRDHSQVGGSHLRAGASGTDFYVDNVESSDGVHATLDSASAFTFQLDPITLDTSGESLTSHAIGTYGGTSGSSLGTATVSSDGSSLTITTDYSPIGSENVRLVVYDAGTKVGETVVPDGEVATIPSIPPFVECGKGVQDLPCYYKRWDNGPFAIVASDGSEYQGDAMELLADDADATVGSLGGFELSGSGVGSATIRDETIQ